MACLPCETVSDSNPSVHNALGVYADPIWQVVGTMTIALALPMVFARLRPSSSLNPQRQEVQQFSRPALAESVGAGTSRPLSGFPCIVRFTLTYLD